jgi:ABC-type multidrug transport system fused ATPase/permease subunit
MQTRPTVANHPAARSRTARPGRAAFRDVTFGGPGGDRSAIEGLSFHAGREELVLLTGPSDVACSNRYAVS